MNTQSKPGATKKQPKPAQAPRQSKPARQTVFEFLASYRDNN